MFTGGDDGGSQLTVSLSTTWLLSLILMDCGGARSVHDNVDVIK